MADSVTTAQITAERLLSEPLPRRWTHVQAVAEKAGQVGAILPAQERPILVAAGWLHDIGYAPGIVDTGLHALDGARWLRSNGFDDRLARLVANHSCAEFEADERGLGEYLRDEFPYEESPTTDALWYADMTTGPDGQDLEVQERLSEIRARYGPDDVVTRFWRKAEPTLLESVNRTLALMSTYPM